MIRVLEAGGLDSARDLKRRCTTRFKYAQQRAGNSVEPDHVHLRQITGMNLRDITDEYLH